MKHFSTKRDLGLHRPTFIHKIQKKHLSESIPSNLFVQKQLRLAAWPFMYLAIWLSPF